MNNTRELDAEDDLKSFKERFCEHVECHPEKYAPELLARILYPHAAICARLTLNWFPRLWTSELTIVTRVAPIQSVQHLFSEASDITSSYRRIGRGKLSLWRKTFKWRISGRKLATVIKEVMF